MSVVPTNDRRPRVLLSSVFAPFDQAGGPYEAPDNFYQVGVFHRCFTRHQGMFSILQQQHTYPLHLIAHNLDADVTVLDYPTLDRFTDELRTGRYDVVAVGCVVSTLGKARRLCAVAKETCPEVITVVGGPGVLGLGELMEPFADHQCRGEGVAFLRGLLGQDPSAPIDFPVVRLHHGNDGLLGLPVKDHNFPVLVGLGCPRQCEFCATSAQFGGHYQPLFERGEELFAFMQKVERQSRQGRGALSYLSFMVYDENFLLQRDFVQAFKKLNREQALREPQFVIFTFGDADILSEHSAEDLLELGIDTIWVGLESPTGTGWGKHGDVDLPALIEDMASSGIRVIGSLVAGLDTQDESAIRRDMDFALGLPTTAVQYMPVNPIPGTALYERLQADGRIRDVDHRWYGMSHYNLRHDSLDEATVLGLIQEFYEREYAGGGPMVFRHLHTRWRGWQRHHASANPWVRARTEVFRRDLLRGFPVLMLGERLGPTPAVRALFADLRREVQGAFSSAEVIRQTVKGQLVADEGITYALMGTPGLRLLLRELLVANAVLRDPRSPGLPHWLLHRRDAEARAGRGSIPWDQPESVVTHYSGAEA